MTCASASPGGEEVTVRTEFALTDLRGQSLPLETTLTIAAGRNWFAAHQEVIFTQTAMAILTLQQPTTIYTPRYLPIARTRNVHPAATATTRLASATVLPDTREEDAVARLVPTSAVVMASAC